MCCNDETRQALSARPHFLPPARATSPRSLIVHPAARYAHITTGASVSFVYVSLISTRPRPIFFVAFSLALSCVALGVSINLLHDPKAMVLPSTNNADMTTNWPPPTHNSPRDRRTPSLDSNSFRVVEILGAVSSALNVLVVAVL